MGFSVSLGFIDPCSFESQASKTPGRDGTQQGPIGGMDPDSGEFLLPLLHSPGLPPGLFRLDLCVCVVLATKWNHSLKAHRTACYSQELIGISLQNVPSLPGDLLFLCFAMRNG